MMGKLGLAAILRYGVGTALARGFVKREPNPYEQDRPNTEARGKRERRKFGEGRKEGGAKAGRSRRRVEKAQEGRTTQLQEGKAKGWHQRVTEGEPSRQPPDHLQLTC